MENPALTEAEVFTQSAEQLGYRSAVEMIAFAAFSMVLAREDQDERILRNFLGSTERTEEELRNRFVDSLDPDAAARQYREVIDSFVEFHRGH